MFRGRVNRTQSQSMRPKDDSNRPVSGDGWLSSTGAKRRLGVDGCVLMHLREAGKLRFEKRGNAFYYLLEDVERVGTKRGA